MITAAVPAGILMPESLLFTDWFRFMAAFVAVNTVMYAALALAKVLPKLQPPDWRRGQRFEPRGIHPESIREKVGAGAREP
jgi:hypothetical protein